MAKNELNRTDPEYWRRRLDNPEIYGGSRTDWETGDIQDQALTEAPRSPAEAAARTEAIKERLSLRDPFHGYTREELDELNSAEE